MQEKVASETERKRKNFMLLLVCMMCFMTAACFGRLLPDPSQEQVNSWDYGPFPENYKEIVLSSGKIKTVNLGEVTYEFQGAPKKGWDREGAGYIYGWKGTVKSFGGNSGATTYQYFIRDGKLLRLLDQNDNRTLRI